MSPLYRLWLCLVVVLTIGSESQAEVPLTARCTIRFATREQGTAAITADDRFTQNLSRFDRQSRMRTDRAVTLDDWKKFVAGEVRDWADDQRQRASDVIASLNKRLAKRSLPWPDEIFLVLTTGREESGAAYCRGNHIILPEDALKRDRPRLEALLAHELFHVLSNQHPELREELYAIVGFKHCRDIPIHASLRDRRITNPDAPTIDCTMEITDKGRRFQTAPVLYSSAAAFDPKREGGLFAYLVFRLMVVEPDGDHWKPVDTEGRAVVIDPKTSADFQEKIGRNTNYIVHPEEILADNFVHLVMERKDLPTPRIVEELKRVLEKR
jgi:hypothetical protein